MKYIIFKDADGTVSQTCVSEGVNIVKHAKILADGRPYKIMALAELPTVEEFFNAWEYDETAGCVSVNMTKAKGIAHCCRREKRAEAFRPLDTEATVPALAAKAEAKRQVIRQADAKVQVAIDSAKTETELKACIT